MKNYLALFDAVGKTPNGTVGVSAQAVNFVARDLDAAKDLAMNAAFIMSNASGTGAEWVVKSIDFVGYAS